MAIVDLRGREHEPDVLALLDPDPAWTVVGWSRDDQLIACAGIQRVSDDEVAIRRIGAHDDPAACALLDAISGVATGSFLVAEVDEQQADLYRNCGFTSENVGPKRVRCVRRLDEAAGQAESVRSMTLDEMEAAIRAAWGRDTSDDPDEWSEANPARGQCDVTALLVRELFGGDILVANVLREGRRVERHAWNRLPSGITLDLTRDQFVNGESLEPIPIGRDPDCGSEVRPRC